MHWPAHLPPSPFQYEVQATLFICCPHSQCLAFSLPGMYFFLHLKQHPCFGLILVISADSGSGYTSGAGTLIPYHICLLNWNVHWVVPSLNLTAFILLFYNGLCHPLSRVGSKCSLNKRRTLLLAPTEPEFIRSTE